MHTAKGSLYFLAVLTKTSTPKARLKTSPSPASPGTERWCRRVREVNAAGSPTAFLRVRLGRRASGACRGSSLARVSPARSAAGGGRRAPCTLGLYLRKQSIRVSAWKGRVAVEPSGCRGANRNSAGVSSGPHTAFAASDLWARICRRDGEFEHRENPGQKGQVTRFCHAVCILHSPHISIWTGLIARAPPPPVAPGRGIGWHRLEPQARIPNLFQVMLLLGSDNSVRRTRDRWRRKLVADGCRAVERIIGWSTCHLFRMGKIIS
nr:uncharacterized protein LOC105856897 [Microcebus murinus]